MRPKLLRDDCLIKKFESNPYRSFTNAYRTEKGFMRSLEKLSAYEKNSLWFFFDDDKRYCGSYIDLNKITQHRKGV